MKKTAFQIFVENIVKTYLSVLKIILMSDLRVPALKKLESNSECYVLGNGPSLNNVLETKLDILEKRKCFGVNFFWKSKYFNKIKPRYYVIASTNYWAKGKIDANEDGRQQTFEYISDNTEWRMTLIVPAIARKYSDWQKTIAKNTNIDIKYINLTPIDGFKTFVNYSLKRNLGLPRPHNVLIPSIKIAIDLKFKEINILGADHSWLKEIFVGEDNKVYLTQKHFYDNKPVPEVMYDGTSNRIRNIADMLMKFVHSFKSYYVLECYAKRNNVNIYNLTKDSYIDAFERKRF